MAKTDAPTITPEQKAEAAKAAKAEKDRERREAITAAAKALEKAGLPRDTQLTPEQRARAATSAKDKPTMTGEALAGWIRDGKSLRQQQADAKAEREGAKRRDPQRQNVTKSQDPEAAELAVAAKKLAPDVRSAFLPKDAREFIDDFKVTRSGQKITISRGDGSADFKLGELRKFAMEGEKNKEIRGALATLGKGSRLWGRKLALMALAFKAPKGKAQDAAPEPVDAPIAEADAPAAVPDAPVETSVPKETADVA